jgi:hypothetical protein
MRKKSNSKTVRREFAARVERALDALPDSTDSDRQTFEKLLKDRRADKIWKLVANVDERPDWKSCTRY